MRVERLSLDEWADALPKTGFEVFHTPAALEVLAEHAPGDLQLYGGFNGQQPVALFPAMVHNRSLSTSVLSPPPALGIPRLGPVLMPASPKQRKREKLNREFTQGILDAAEVGATFTLFRTVCTTAYGDPRPFSWADLGFETSFTYALDVDGRDADGVLTSFSKSLRREIRDGDDLDVTVSVEGVDGAREVYCDTRRRYREQNRGFPMGWEYVRDLLVALGDRARVYVARDGDGEYLSGVTVLYSNDAAYFWQGGTRTTVDGTSVNSLLHWQIIRDVIEDPPVESVTRYDLMGANTERLCRYKSKFGADLVPYYVVESRGRGMDWAKRAYRMLAR